ncbi:MAG TPA: RNA polymerase sigma-70 factor [Chloroflexaceae bacterium]|nr:RNA polymerase sigma-70 factor [Chloroflexaceae bacterium]
MPIEAEEFERQRGALFAIAYRMLGSASEAEDVVQDAFLRASGAGDEVRSPRAFLTTVTTRLALDRLKAARSAREQYIGPWLPEPLLQQPDGAGEERAERGEAVAMAFLVLLEQLSPLERAVFLLRESFEYPFDEIGAMLGRSAAACRQAHHRARAHLDAARPRFRAEPEQQLRLVSGFLAAAREGRLETLRGMLTDDVTFWGDGGGAAAAARRPVRGAEEVARLMAGLTARAAEAPSSYSLALDWVNGEPGLLVWEGDRLATVMVFECDADQIVAIRAVRNPAKLAHLGARATPPEGPGWAGG